MRMGSLGDMPCELIRAMVEDGIGTWLRADPVGRLFAQPARRRDAAASARRRAEFMEDPRACGPCGPFLGEVVQLNTAESRAQLRLKCRGESNFGALGRCG